MWVLSWIELNKKLIFGLILCLLESTLHDHLYTIITHCFLCESILSLYVGICHLMRVHTDGCLSLALSWWVIHITAGATTQVPLLSPSIRMYVVFPLSCMQNCWLCSVVNACFRLYAIMFVIVAYFADWPALFPPVCMWLPWIKPKGFLLTWGIHAPLECVWYWW